MCNLFRLFFKYLTSLHQYSQQPEDIPIEPPQHEIQQIELYNDGSGLGFGIVGVRDVGIMVKTILPGGTADRVSPLFQTVTIKCYMYIVKALF